MANSFNIGEGSTAPAKGPIELKVKVATAAAAVAPAVFLFFLQWFGDNPDLFASLPDGIEPFIVGLVTAIVTFAASWNARHTPRTDAAAIAP